MNTSYQRNGFFNRLRTRLFGERDLVDEQIHEISRQGTGMARAAHVCALALIVLFSLGSLVALSGDALQSILLEWRAGQVDIPAAISVAVSTLLVLCMDVGMVYAASVVRLLIARRAPASERRMHETVMFIVAVLEASTYAYMSVRYEHPTNLMVWLLILARAAAAPVLSVYLSMARVLPVLPRDILYQVELATGKGVLRDTVELANDSAAPLSKKLRMYESASIMTETDRARLVSLVQVVQSDEVAAPPLELVVSEEPGPDFPNGGGTPGQVPVVISELSDEPRKPVALARIPEESVVVPLRPAARRAASSRRVSGRRFPSREAERAAGFALLDEAGWSEKKDKPALSKAAFIRTLGINGTRANELYTRWELAHRSHHASPVVEGDFAQ